MYNEIFIARGKSEKYDNKFFISDVGAMSHISKEEKMTNLRDAETKVTVRESGTIYEKKQRLVHL